MGTGLFRVLGGVLVAVVVVALLAPRQPNLAFDRTWVRVGFIACVTAWVAVVVAGRRLAGSRAVRGWSEGWSGGRVGSPGR